jgi:hypothetical protein
MSECVIGCFHGPACSRIMDPCTGECATHKKDSRDARIRSAPRLQLELIEAAPGLTISEFLRARRRG